MPDHQDDDLAAELRGLSTWMDVGEPADQRTAVRARLARLRLARRRVRWWIASVVAAIVGTVALVAPARAAVVDAVGVLLRVTGIEVSREPGHGGLPTRSSPLPAVRSVALDEARRAALFPVRVPDTLGTPEQVLLADRDDKGAPRVVTLTYRGGAVRFDQFDGTVSPVFLKSAPDARWMGIGQDFGIWLPGPHAVTYVGRDGVERTETARAAGPTLIWASGAVTYRLEGLPTLQEALDAALSLKE
jgi:hypothetical protein